MAWLAKSPITLPKRGNTSEGQCQRDHWKAEKFLAQHCNVPAGTCVSCDVRNHRLYHHSPRDQQLRNLLHYRSTHHGYRYSTRAVRNHTTVEVVGENETAGHADNNYSTLAGCDYHDCPDYWVHFHSFDTFTPVSIPHRRWTLHHSGSILFNLYNRSDKTTTLGRASGQGRRTRKNEWLERKEDQRGLFLGGQVIARKPTRA